MTLDIDLNRLRQLLKQRRAQLEDLIAGAREQVRPVELDQTRVGRLSRVDALQGQAMARETERRRQIDLQRVDAALERIDDGNFGYCVLCGEPIPIKRLEFDPAITTCVGCANN